MRPRSTARTHGERKVIGYDTTETLVYKRPELYVLVRKYPKYACAGNPECGVASPERPTSLVEGDRYDTSVAAAVVEAKWFLHLPIYRHQDIFAGSGWTPSRSTLVNLVSQVDFVTDAAGRLHDPPGPAGHRRGHRRHELPDAPAQGSAAGRFPATPRAGGWRRRSPRRGPRAIRACWRRCGPTSGLHLAPYNIFD